MISNDAQLNQALEQLGRMYRALADLRKDILPLNVRNFAVMAEGPVDEIRKLQKEINAYTGMDLVVFDDQDAPKSADAETHVEMGSIGS